MRGVVVRVREVVIGFDQHQEVVEDFLLAVERIRNVEVHEERDSQVDQRAPAGQFFQSEDVEVPGEAIVQELFHL